jgi:hypothetical protein
MKRRGNKNDIQNKAAKEFTEKVLERLFETVFLIEINNLELTFLKHKALFDLEMDIRKKRKIATRFVFKINQIKLMNLQELKVQFKGLGSFSDKNFPIESLLKVVLKSKYKTLFRKKLHQYSYEMISTLRKEYPSTKYNTNEKSKETFQEILQQIEKLNPYILKSIGVTSKSADPESFYDAHKKARSRLKRKDNELPTFRLYSIAAARIIAKQENPCRIFEECFIQLISNEIRSEEYPK